MSYIFYVQYNGNSVDTEFIAEGTTIHLMNAHW